MSALEVVFNVPSWIESGLRNGTLERVGGVIVDSSSKQVVAWLRDGGLVEHAINLGSKLPNLFGIIMNAAKAALTLHDGNLTRQAIAGVQESVSALETAVAGVQETTNFVVQQAGTITTLATFTAAGQVVNIALATATFRATMQRLDLLREDIEGLKHIVREEFSRDRDMKFFTAIQAAQDVFDKVTPAPEAAQFAINQLYEARRQFMLDFKKTLEAYEQQGDESYLELANHYLFRAIYAEITRIRCYLEQGDVNIAMARLDEVLDLFVPPVKKLIRAWLGDSLALYIHPGMPIDGMDRFLQVEMWLRTVNLVEHPPATRVMFTILSDLQTDFWKPDFVDSNNKVIPLRLIQRGRTSELEQKINTMYNNLKQAELLIENYSRLQGFKHEIAAISRLSDERPFRAWYDLADTYELSKHGGTGLIIDRAMVERLKLQ